MNQRPLPLALVSSDCKLFDGIVVTRLTRRKSDDLSLRRLSIQSESALIGPFTKSKKYALPLATTDYVLRLAHIDATLQAIRGNDSSLA